jgi:Ca2+-binding RTX toxin-like protein
MSYKKNGSYFGGSDNDALYSDSDLGDIRVYGLGGSDSLFGDYGNNFLYGGSGNDYLADIEGNDFLYGDGGDDILSGGNGNDYLNGGTGFDYLYGDGGKDILIGGTGNDDLFGGAGQDIFRFIDRSKDNIKDFSVKDDTIQLENNAFTKLAKVGVLNAANFKIGAVAADKNDFIVYNSKTGALFYDDNGNGAGHSTQIAIIGTHLALTNSDFVIT